MTDTILYFIHYTLLLLFGILLSAAFADVAFTKKNTSILLGLFALCGLIQLGSLYLFDELLIWKIYPLITHLPIALLLCLYYHKHITTTIAAVATAYLCCQPAKWIGIIIASLTGSYAAEQIARILTLTAAGVVVIRYFAPSISRIFNRDHRSTFIFGSIPVVYYLFDYAMGIYTDLWMNNVRAAVEFLPFILCIAYLVFCIIYYQEYEKKTDAERKEQIVRITINQQAKEMEAVRRSEQEIRILRHDMRLFLNNLSICMDKEGREAAKKMISSFASNVESTAVHRYCENATVNYILSDCAAKCAKMEIEFSLVVEIQEFWVDEIIFSSILSNALDNALNAQKELPESERSIKLMLKTHDSKLLLSVRNPFDRKPTFVDGMPVSGKAGHGYGTQSIRYMAERLGGNCQFTTEGNTFILRVVL